MSERPKPIETRDERKPFVIRGHHLTNFRLLLKRNFGRSSTPEEVARGVREDYDPRNRLYPLDSRAVTDTIGTKEEDADTFERAMKTVYEQFVALPDDYPVKLSEGRKDNICETCPIKGDHCTARDQTPFGGIKDMVLVDGEYFNSFLKKAREEKAAITLREELAPFSDSPPEMIRTIQTNAATFKAVLRVW
jgi:hypothetical protein